MKKHLGLLTVVVLGTALGLGFSLLTEQEPAPKPGPYDHLGGDFTLQSAAGPLSLADLRGKVVPIYFGFTHCPDICPTTLQRLGQAMNTLNANEQKQVHGLFITVDPERDDVERVSGYASHFGKNITGLTGTLEEITAVAKQYLVIFAKVETPDSAMGYTMDHSSSIYLLGKDGKIKARLSDKETVAGLAAALREAL